jgi:uncharacterized Zn-binding protein involved in type VI secretion
VSAPAVRMGDVAPCPATAPKPHEAATVVSGNATVLVGGVPAAHVGSAVVCSGVPAPNAVAVGSATVLVGGLGVARLGDATAHGGVLVPTQGTVLVG